MADIKISALPPTQTIAGFLSKTIYVDTNGSDVTGVGTPQKPLATVAAAQALISGATLSSPWTIKLSSGTFNATTFSFSPNVCLVGDDVDITYLVCSGNITLDSGFSGISSIMAIKDITIECANILLDASSGSSGTNILFNFSNSIITSPGVASIVGPSVSGTLLEFSLSGGSTFIAATSFTTTDNVNVQVRDSGSFLGSNGGNTNLTTTTNGSFQSWNLFGGEYQSVNFVLNQASGTTLYLDMTTCTTFLSTMSITGNARYRFDAISYIAPTIVSGTPTIISLSTTNAAGSLYLDQTLSTVPSGNLPGHTLVSLSGGAPASPTSNVTYARTTYSMNRNIGQGIFTGVGINSSNGGSTYGVLGYYITGGGVDFPVLKWYTPGGGITAALEISAGSSTITFTSTGTMTGLAGISTAALTLNGTAVPTTGTIVSSAVATNYTAQQNFGTVALTDASPITWNLNSQQVASILLTSGVGATRQLQNPSNMVAGGTYILFVKQSATGSNALTYDTAYKWPGGSAPILSTAANAQDILTFVSDGTNMYGVAQLGFA